MPTYQRADEELQKMAKSIILEFPTHKPLIDADVKIDFVFAYPKYDQNGEPCGDAIRRHGCRALGLARKLSLKDRAMGRGDAEILIDAEWWKDANEEERRALLDHEIHHVAVKTNKKGAILKDDLGRPQIGMRPHDFEFGWFKEIAVRHGENAQERIQAKLMMDNAGQYFWPGLMNLEIKKAA